MIIYLASGPAGSPALNKAKAPHRLTSFFVLKDTNGKNSAKLAMIKGELPSDLTFTDNDIKEVLDEKI